MYNFHYDYMMKNYPSDKIKLLYTDIDSFVYEMKSDDFYADIEDDIDLYFDTSNICNICEVKMRHKGVKKCLSDNGINDDSREEKKCESKRISYKDFEKVLFEGAEIYQKMNIIKSEGHNICSVGVNKLALSGCDDNKVLREDGVGSYVFGHWRVL